MKYVKSFLIKLVVTLAALFIVLGLFFDATLGDILIMGTLLTVVAFVGDMFLLPKIGNVWAAVADFALAFVAIWALGSVLFEQNQDIAIISAAFLSALFVFGAELYYHRYLRDHVFFNVDQPNNYSRTHNVQTEFAKEFDEEFKKSKNNMS